MELIARDYGITLSVRAVGDYLKRFTPRKPIQRADEQRPETIWKWLDGAYPAERLIAFLEALIKNTDRKIFPILDNLRVHHAKPVKAHGSMTVGTDCPLSSRKGG